MAKSFQDRIKDLEPYRPDITYKDGAFILKIKFNERWQIITPKDKDVACAPDGKVNDLYWYCSTIENSDKLFDLIDETIAINKEFEKKALLYKEKVKELQELFLSDISYDKLKTIQFIMPEKETKPKPKKTVAKATKEKQTKPVEEKPMIADERVQETSKVENSETITRDKTYKGDIDAVLDEVLGDA